MNSVAGQVLGNLLTAVVTAAVLYVVVVNQRRKALLPGPWPWPIVGNLVIFAIHRDPSVYESPDEFKPSRFVERPEVNLLSRNNHFELIPFSDGRRVCPGANLANVMVTSILANLLLCFDWALPGGGGAEALDMAECFSLMSRRRQPLRLVAHPRRAASLFRELP